MGSPDPEALFANISINEPSYMDMSHPAEAIHPGDKETRHK
jgi:hypothetical protein